MKIGAITWESSEHYTWGGNCDGWYLVRDASLNVIEEQMPAGASEALHFHNRAQQFFYVLRGEAVMEVGSEEVRLAAGQGLHIRAGVPHCIRNCSDQPIRFLVISQPPSHADRVNLK